MYHNFLYIISIISFYLFIIIIDNGLIKEIKGYYMNKNILNLALASMLTIVFHRVLLKLHHSAWISFYVVIIGLWWTYN